jgi:DNA-3-methyladenine glycosylase I
MFSADAMQLGGTGLLTHCRLLFEKIEATLISTAIEHGVTDIREQLNEYKSVPGRGLTEEEHYRQIVEITFYSGFKAVTVNQKLPSIHRWFPDHCTVAQYGPEQVKQMLSDPQMIRHEQKLKACIENAKTFAEIVRSFGSFQRYVESFKPEQSFENLLALRSDLIEKFAYLGNVTSLHFLMEMGLRVLKPDRVVVRVFHRLGFLPDETFDEEDLLEAIWVGYRFSEATGHPIRYIDIVFVAYGQVNSGLSIEQGICLKHNPHCAICGVKEFCDYNSESEEIPKNVVARESIIAIPTDTARPNPIERPASWKQKGGPCPICKWPETVSRRSRTTDELYFGCARPRRGSKGGCPFTGCRSH